MILSSASLRVLTTDSRMLHANFDTPVVLRWMPSWLLFLPARSVFFREMSDILNIALQFVVFIMLLKMIFVRGNIFPISSRIVSYFETIVSASVRSLISLVPTCTTTAFGALVLFMSQIFERAWSCMLADGVMDKDHVCVHVGVLR